MQPSVIGFLALDVDLISKSPDSFLTSQAQPEPKVLTATSENLDLKSAKEPKTLLICSNNLPFGSPPPLGDKQFQ